MKRRRFTRAEDLVLIWSMFTERDAAATLRAVDRSGEPRDRDSVHKRQKRIARDVALLTTSAEIRLVLALEEGVSRAFE
jgi:hypothetical protein